MHDQLPLSIAMIIFGNIQGRMLYVSSLNFHFPHCKYLLKGVDFYIEVLVSQHYSKALLSQ